MSVNNDNFLIETNDIELAQSKVSDITDNNIRNRAMANVLAAELAFKYFTDVDIDIQSGIHNIVKVLKNIDISDIYINGNYVDVRICFSDNELFVPKIHYEMEMLPVAYMFIKLDSDLSAGCVTGFIFPEDIDTENVIGNYYQVNEECLKSFYDVEQRLAIVDDEDIDIPFKEYIYDYLDGKSSGEFVYKELIKSVTARKFLADAANADSVLNLLDVEKLGTNVSTVYKETNDPDVLNNVITAPEEILEPELVDNSEMVAFDDSEFPELTEIEPLENQDNLELMDEGSINNVDLLSETNDVNLEMDVDNPDIADLPQDSYEEIEQNESEIESGNAEVVEDSPSNVINNEIEELEIEDFENDENLEEDNKEIEELFENPDFVSNIETSGQLSQSVVPNKFKPRLVVVQDEPVQQTNDDEFKELSKFDYSTEIMPSISSIESSIAEDAPITEEMLDKSENASKKDSFAEQSDAVQNEEQIENLFGQEPHKAVNTGRKKKSPLSILGFIIILIVLGCYRYTKFYSQLPDVINNTTVDNNYENIKTDSVKKNSEETAMPVETVENVQVPKTKDEGVSVSIPAIEQNLNASIDVSNLSVNWEVPLSYANNTTAKRYFVKIGKVLQLNLKTELLFLSSSPITNKISIELEFDTNSNKFVISRFSASSGITVIDNVIKDTVEKALNMNLNTNMSVFKNLQGKPVLVIKL